MNAPCPCQSGEIYEVCCAPYHQSKNAPSAVALMRSRYCAFVLGLVDYLVETTHPAHRTTDLKEEIIFTCKAIKWTKLEIVELWQGGVNDKVGKVLFRASFIQNNLSNVHEEKSRFKRFGKAWSYVDGDIKK